MALTLSGTNGVVGAGFTVDASGVSVTAGVGTFSSIGAGASVPAAGLTGALPTISAANCTNIPAANITGTLPAISGANLTGLSSGLSVVDNWYINSSISVGSGTNTLSANWERGTSAIFGSIGSAMTQSSGVFTFPSTGIYYCSINGSYYRGSGHRRYLGFTIQTTTDDSSYSNATSNYDSVSGDTTDNTYGQVTSTFVFDVTNTSTHKVRFQTEAVDSGASIVDVAGRHLNVVFMRLGDT